MFKKIIKIIRQGFCQHSFSKLRTYNVAGKRIIIRRCTKCGMFIRVDE